MFNCGKCQRKKCKCGGEGWSPDPNGKRWCPITRQWMGRGNLPTKSLETLLARPWGDLKRAVEQKAG